jgi:ribosomal protein L34
MLIHLNNQKIFSSFFQPTNTNKHHRHVTFQKRPSTATGRFRHSNNNNVLVERHAPTNNIRS